MNNFPIQGFTSGVEHRQGHLVSFEDPEAQLLHFFDPEMGPEPLSLPHGPAFAPVSVFRPVNSGFLDPTLVHQPAAAAVRSLGPHATQNLVALGVLPPSHTSFRGVSAGPVLPGVPSPASVGPAGHPAPAFAGSAGPPVPALASVAPQARASAAPAPSDDYYEKRTKGFKRPDQPDRPIPPPCDRPTSVMVKMRASLSAGKEIGGINPDWTVLQLKQHFCLQTSLGGIPAEKQALRLNRPAAPGFDPAVPLEDVIVLKDVGIDPTCVIWLERRVESGGVPAPAVAPVGAPAALKLPTGQPQFRAVPAINNGIIPNGSHGTNVNVNGGNTTHNGDTINGNAIQYGNKGTNGYKASTSNKGLNNDYSNNTRLAAVAKAEEVSGARKQFLLARREVVKARHLNITPAFNQGHHGTAIPPGQLRGGGTGPLVGESVGVAGLAAPQQAGSVDPAILRQQLVLRERRRSNHHEQQQQHRQQQKQHHQHHHQKLKQQHQLRQQQEQQLKQQEQQQKQQQQQRALPAENPATINGRGVPTVTPRLPRGGGVPSGEAPAVSGLEARLLAWQNGVSATGLKQPQQQQQPGQQQQLQQQQKQSYVYIGNSYVDIGIDDDIGIDVNIGNDDDYYGDFIKIPRESDVSAIINGSKILTQRRQRQQQQDQQRSLAAAAVNQNDPANNDGGNVDDAEILRFCKDMTIGVWPDDDESAP